MAESSMPTMYHEGARLEKGEWAAPPPPATHTRREVHLQRKGAPNNSCKISGTFELPSVSCGVTATVLHLSGGRQGDRRKGNRERQSTRRQPQRGQDSRLNVRGSGRRGGMEEMPTQDSGVSSILLHVGSVPHGTPVLPSLYSP